METVVVISKDEKIRLTLDKILSDFYSLYIFDDMASSIEYIKGLMPNMLIIDIDISDYSTIELIAEFKNDPVFGQIPIIAIFSEMNIAPMWEHIYVDDFLWRRCLEMDILVRTSLGIRRAERVVEISPLTRLPGNIAINKQIQKRLDAKEIFAVGYADIDYFKPFNDKYGFSRGDDVLKMTAKNILKHVKEIQPKDSFVGHIGGDDFIFIMDVDAIEDAAGNIICEFDEAIQGFYDEQDRIKGYIESVDREGIKKRFPVMCLSIGIAHTKFRRFSHYSEMAEVASEMKRYAKRCYGSCYRIDKRTYAGA